MAKIFLTLTNSHGKVKDGEGSQITLVRLDPRLREDDILSILSILSISFAFFAIFAAKNKKLEEISVHLCNLRLNIFLTLIPLVTLIRLDPRLREDDILSIMSILSKYIFHHRGTSGFVYNYAATGRSTKHKLNPCQSAKSVVEY